MPSPLLHALRFLACVATRVLADQQTSVESEVDPSLQMSADQKRSLKIKTGAVKRTSKEYLSYFTEKKKEEAFLEKMRIISADPYDIKQQENVVQESQMMIPETKKQLEGLLADLKQYFADVGGDLGAESDEGMAAAEVIAAAEESMKD